MTIKDHIEHFIQQNNSVLDFLDTIPDYENLDLLIPDYLKFLVKSKYNPALGINLLMTLQLSNDARNYNQYELDDLQKLFKSFLELQPFEIDMYVEAAHFEWAVMDDEKKAKEVIQKGIESAKEKITELVQLLEKINNPNN